jgi:hypothetical protein
MVREPFWSLAYAKAILNWPGKSLGIGALAFFVFRIFAWVLSKPKTGMEGAGGLAGLGETATNYLSVGSKERKGGFGNGVIDTARIGAVRTGSDLNGLVRRGITRALAPVR